jgi:hypothetical protein
MKTGLSLQSQIPRLSVVDNGPKAPQDDEVILCVRYTTFVGWLVLIGVMFLVYIFCDALYRLIPGGKYVEALIVGAAASVMLAGAIDFLFTKHVLFYRDRIVKVWHFLGQKTIPYERAKLIVSPRFVQRRVWPLPNNGFRISLTDKTGRTYPIQIPVLFPRICVAAETRKKAEFIVSYLADVEDTSKLYEKSRIFTKSTLPKDILRQDRSNSVGGVG